MIPVACPCILQTFIGVLLVFTGLELIQVFFVCFLFIYIIYIYIYIERERERESEWESERETDRQTDRERERQRETDRERHRERQTEADRKRQTDRDRQRQTHTEKYFAVEFYNSESSRKRNPQSHSWVCHRTMPPELLKAILISYRCWYIMVSDV